LKGKGRKEGLRNLHFPVALNLFFGIIYFHRGVYVAQISDWMQLKRLDVFEGLEGVSYAERKPAQPYEE